MSTQPDFLKSLIPAWTAEGNPIFDADHYALRRKAPFDYFTDYGRDDSNDTRWTGFFSASSKSDSGITIYLFCSDKDSKVTAPDGKTPYSYVLVISPTGVPKAMLDHHVRIETSASLLQNPPQLQTSLIDADLRSKVLKDGSVSLCYLVHNLRPGASGETVPTLYACTTFYPKLP